MKHEKNFTVGIAIGCLLSLCACQATTSQQHSETTALTTEEVKTGIGTLQNQMSEQEQKRVSVGALTLLGQNTADASSSEQPVVEVELWDNGLLELDGRTSGTVFRARLSKAG